MADHPSSSPFTIWSGIDIATEDEQALAEINDFYASGYKEALAKTYPSLVEVKRFELIATDRHGGFGAKLLTALIWSGEQESDDNAIQSELAVPGAPSAWRDGTAISWSLLYRFVAETTPASAPPHAIYFVGVNPPPGMSDEDHEAFVEFYTSVHVPEVAKRRHCTHATVYELDRELLEPNEGTPQFLGVYEVADEASVVTRHVGFGYKRGPAVWEKHKTPWRLWYRNVRDEVS